MRKTKRHNIFQTNYTNIEDNQNIKAVIYTLWNKNTGWCTEYDEFPSEWSHKEKLSAIKYSLSKSVFSCSIVIETFDDTIYGERKLQHTASMPVMKKNKSNMLTLLDCNIAALMDISNMWCICPKYMNEALRYNMLPKKSKSHADPVFTDDQLVIAY
jgi:hypothetical protein